MGDREYNHLLKALTSGEISTDDLIRLALDYNYRPAQEQLAKAAKALERVYADTRQGDLYGNSASRDA
jgi:hypothetical protein